MRKTDLNLLTSLDALLRHRSVTNAATELGLTQSAMSHNLRRLREAFADDLFTRTSTGLSTTPYAATLAEPVQRLLSEIDTLLGRDDGFDPLTAERTFNVALQDVSELILVPEIVNRIGVEAPGLRLNLSQLSKASVLKRLDEGTIDLAIGDFEEGQVHHKRRLLHLDEYLCLFNPAILKGGSPETLEGFLEATHIVVDGPADAVGAALARRKASRRVRVTTPHLLSVPFLVQRTPAVAVVPGVLARRFSEMLSLEVCRVPLDLPNLPIAVLWHSSLDGDAGHQWLRSVIVDAVNTNRRADA